MFWAPCGSSSTTQLCVLASYWASQWEPGFLSCSDAACGSAWATVDRLVAGQVRGGLGRGGGHEQRHRRRDARRY